MTIERLLLEAAALGISLRADGDQLRVKASKGTLSAELKAALSAHKPALVELLKEKAAVRSDSGIPRANRDGHLPLSFAQQRLWVLDQLEGGRAIYHVPACAWLDGPLNVEALQSALAKTALRHEILRTTFDSGRGEPSQQIGTLAPSCDIEDLSGRADAEPAATQAATALARIPFDLAKGPLVRARLFRTGADRHLLSLTFHHIVADAWSMRVLMSDVTAYYDEARTGAPAALSPLAVQYADFSAWQRDRLQGDALTPLLAYWRGALEGAEPLIELPLDRPRPAVQSFAGAIATFSIDAGRTARIRAIGDARGATLFQSLLAAFQLLLHRYSGQSSIVVGSPIANRLRADLEPLIGFFVNTIALRADFDPQLTFDALLEQVKATTLAAYAHQELPFELLVSDLSPARSLSHSPIFQVMFALQNARAPQTRMGDIAVTPGTVALGASKFDWYLSLEERPDGSLAGEWEYATDLFDAATVERAIGHFSALLDAIAADPEARITRLSLLDAAEERRLTRDWNRSEQPWPVDRTLAELISAQAARTPGAIAVDDGMTRLTYAELERGSNQVAHHLQNAGVGLETLVGLVVERSTDAIAGLIGILKAGAAYVPLDPAYPKDRLAFMAEDAALRYFVAQESTRRDLPAGATIVSLDGDRDRIRAERDDAPEPVDSDSLAYIIYTSGSTGRPKGIQIEHRNAVSMLAWAASAYTPDDVRGMLASTSLCFDLSIFEIFLPLTLGGTVIVADNALALADHPSRDRVTLINTVPSAMAELVRAGQVPDSVQIVNLAGEPLSRSLVDRIYDTTAVRDVFDLYGPGETTTYSTFGRREREGRESIGRPIANTRLYILDSERRPVPIGVSGEIYIGGPGVARGYLNRDELTAERFVPDPFNSGWMYRTGDIGRYWLDGRIQFLGRADQQIKLRGFRIELGEIEHAMLGGEGVRDAVAQVRHDEGHAPRLVAYYTGEVSAPALRDRLSAQLPSFMVPSALVRLDTLPRTPNGKIDRRALPAVDTRAGDREIVAPASDRESALCAIWSEVLRRERVGVTDNFFEIGGDSILAIQIVSKARSAGLTFAPAALFQHQTIRELALIATSAAAERRDDEAGDVSLTAIQRWGLAGDLPRPQHFNQWVLLELPAGIRTAVVRDAVQAVAAHHGAFRLRFAQRDGEWRQWYVESAGLAFAEEAVESPAALDAVAKDIQQSLDLELGPVGRAVLFRLPHQASRLLISIHHLIVDGVSWRIICDDLLIACRALERGERPRLPEPTASYQRWATAAADPVADVTPQRRLGTYREVRSVAGEIDQAVTARLLEQASAAYGARLDEALCAALAAALSEWDGHATHAIDVEGHGRDVVDGIDVSRTVGWFTHFSTVTLTRDPRHGWPTLITAAKQTCRKARKGAFTTRGAISLNYLGRLDQALPAESGWKLAATGFSSDPERPRRHAIDVAMSIRDGRLSWTIDSTDRLHPTEEIARLSRIVSEQIDLLAAHCADPASGGYAPVDFPDVAVAQADLDAIRALGPRFHRNIESILPVGDAQEGILFHCLLAGSSDVYLTQLRCAVTGIVDVGRFRQAWRTVIARHGALRTVFVRDAQQHLLQVTLREVPFEIAEEDWRQTPPSHTEARAERERRPFDLATAPLMRVALARTGDASWQFVWTSHHAVLDGWSLGAVLQDLAACYGAAEPASPALLPYRHYVRAAARPTDSADEAFWRSEVDGWCEPLDSGFVHPATGPGQRATTRVTLAAAESSRLQQYARAHRLTLHTLLQAAWAVTLSRYSDRDDVLFGGVVSGRAEAGAPGADRAAGLFIKTLPVRVQVRDDDKLTTWLAALQQRQLEREFHAHVPAVKIREMAPLPRGVDLFDTLIVLENYPVDEALQRRLGELEVSGIHVFERPHYPLTITVSSGSQLAIAAVYDPGRVDTAAIGPLLDRFAHVLNQLAAGDAETVGDLTIVSAGEYRRVIVEWNATERAYETGVTLTDLFERQVARTPEAAAVVCGDESLTYAQLDARANQVGHALQRDGAGRDTLVGVCLERSLEMVIALYGILKAGAAYVPIDPSYPQDRRELMIRDSGVTIVLDRARVAGITGSTERPERDCGAGDLAYMIYTSGSTGMPKGALNVHAAIVNRLLWMQEAFGLRDDDRVLQKTPFSFDVSVWEFFWPLITGAQLVVAEPGGHLDPSYLANAIERHRITTLHFVPSMLQVFLETRNLARARGIRRVITSGEALTPDHVKTFNAAFPHAELHNLYGPTEAAVDVTWWPCPRDPDIALVPIGKPIANTRMYVLDRRLRPVPAGVAGELYIGGVQVGRGYWGRPELTAERFLIDPFAETAGARMYRTGDRARFLPDGAIEYLGRVDHQVKIRGVRIELGEIEAVLRAHESVRDVVAIARSHRGETQLVAYVVAAGAAPINAAALRAYARTRLPEVMVPAFISTIEAIPLSPNGKLDRRALPDPSEAPRHAPAEAAGSLSTIERTIADAWTAVLGHATFGTADNFFDVGGHSLSAMRVHGLLQQSFGPALTLLTLFEHPTVAALARHLAGTAPAPLARVTRRRPNEGPYDIAVIGMACRVPGASTIEAFWDNLIEGREQITRFTPDELVAAGEDPDRLRDPHYVNAYGALANAEHFDAAFFDIHRPEAEILDPQQRVFLECAWEVFERAGYDPSRLSVPVGVYAGAGLNSYALHHIYSRPDVVAERGAFPLLISSDKDFLPTRVSYKLNLKGPSLNVQSGCSTSLVAIDLACESLLRGDCDMAVAGGVTIRFPQARGHVHEEGMIFSPDGHTRTFDAKAAGMVTGSGAGAVLLKRLDDALADGDHVHAVIKGSAINNDGAAKVGYTSPSIEGQARVIAEALDRARVEPRSIGYVEAHGTATPVGDPIEIAALSRAWRRTTTATQFCAIGSVKTNVGHLDAAAGVTGFIKAVLALAQGRVPPSLHFESPNPALGLEASPFFVNAAPVSWPSSDGPRRAAVSAFGIGGTNAHVILEQAPAAIGSGLSRPHHVLALSARTDKALNTLAAGLAETLERQPALSLADVALTLLDGRAQFKHRRAVVAHDAREAIALLRGDVSPSIHALADRHDRPVVFLFPGYGAQYAGMARGLYDTEPVFHEALDRAAAILAPHLGGNVVEVIFDSDSSVLRQTPWAHPALVAIEHSLVELWGSWGVKPAAVLGNSLGEYTAACVAGVFTLDDLLPLVADRARLIAAAAPGAMLAVSLGESDIAPHLSGSLSLAVCVTGSSSVVSGTRDDLDRFAERMVALGADIRRIDADCAPHSAFMDDAAKELHARVASIQRSTPRIPLLSNVTGTWMTAAQATDPGYWAAHLRSTVRLADCFDRLTADHQDACVLEAGPGRTMASPFTAQAPRQPHPPIVVTSLRHPNERQSDSEFIMSAAAQLWASGVTLDARGMYAREHRQRIELPTYPFERQRYSIEPGHRAVTIQQSVDGHIALPTWERLPAAPAEAAAIARAIVFADSTGVGAAIVKQLQRQGAPVVVVTAGSEYSQSGHSRIIRRTAREDYERVLRSMAGAPDAVVHCWSLDPASDDPAALDAAFHSPILLAQALGDANVDTCRIAIASSGVHRVIGNEQITAIKATVAGPARVIPQEFDGFTVVHVDREDGDLDHDRFAAALLAELATSTDPTVAYRHGLRWCRRFSAADQSARPARLRDGATYVVTGGLSGVGLELAAAIAGETTTPHLLLIGRTATNARRRAAMARLESLGARVSVAVADVADRTAIERVLNEHHAQSPVRGIVHAAGIPGGGAISLKTREAAEREFAAKIDGTRQLCAWAQGRDLDFVALCSSTSAFIGGFGSVAYTAANAFLDAIADEHTHLPILSINWHRWQGLGMAIETERLHEQLAGTPLVDGIRASNGRAAFVRLLGRPELNRAAVCPVDLNLVERESRGFVARREPAIAETPSTARTLAAASTPMQKALAEVWCDVLRLDDVGVDEPFTSLGGDSLLAVRVVSRIRTSVGVALPIRALYEKPTIAQLAAYAETLKAGAAAAIPRVARSASMPLSSAQRRFWLLHALDGSGGAYNVVKVVRLRGALAAEAFRLACHDIVDRHEILRTSFALKASDPVQQVHDAVEFDVRIADLSSIVESDRADAARTMASEETRRPFDLTRAPLIRVTLIRLGADDHVALFVLHHIVADGRSIEILFEEMAAAYQARQRGAAPAMTALPVQYADYAAFERGWLASDAAAEQIAWWRQQLAGGPALLTLPTDHPRPAVQSYAGDAVMFTIPPPLTSRLKAIAESGGASLFMTVTSALASLLARYSGQAEVCIASAVENRPFRETEGLLGAFLNTIVMRVDCGGDPSFGDLVRRVRTTALDAYEHQSAPFERVVDAVQPDRRIAASPIAQVMVSWLDGERGFPALSDVRAEPFDIDHRTVKSDLDLEIYDTAGELHVAWFYSTALFRRESMAWMIDDFLRLIESAATAPATRLSALGLRSPADRGSLLPLTHQLPEAPLGGEGPFVTPRNDLERDIAAVWSSLLGIDTISVNADLFSIGGHSLVAVRIAARLSEQLQIELAPAVIFNAPTIAGLAAAITSLRAEQLEAILADVEGLSDDEAKARLT